MGWGRIPDGERISSTIPVVAPQSMPICGEGRRKEDEDEDRDSGRWLFTL
jgi:hypothetical protein